MYTGHIYNRIKDIGNKIYLHTAAITAAVFFLQSCNIDPEIEPQVLPYTLAIPTGFSYPEIPVDNELTTEKIALGKKLFFDPILSVDSSIACASCHKPEHAFSDNVALSKGVNDAGGFRNAISLANVAYVFPMMRDGGTPTLETQVEIPIQTDFEMDYNYVLLSERLNKHPEYIALFQQAFQRNPDPFSIARALSCFERILISGNSPYDAYAFQHKESALTDSQKRGMDLFFSNDLNCSACHQSFTFTNNTFENNGLYVNYDADEGRARITLNDSDIGKFKVPTLRNIELTAPYMHDGSIGSLSAVIDFYMTGGSTHPNKSNLIKPFTLTESQKTDLINFLYALTDSSFIKNTAFIP